MYNACPIYIYHKRWHSPSNIFRYLIMINISEIHLVRLVQKDGELSYMKFIL